MNNTEVPAEYYDQNDSDNICYLCENPKYFLKYQKIIPKIPKQKNCITKKVNIEILNKSI